MNSECCICFELVRSTEKQNPFATRCGHLFHENCIKSCLDNQSKCPQCNQPTLRSQLVRLYINEPGNSTEAKDEVIERLRLQLKELNEKAQLQYDLIAALNKQIKEKEKSPSETNGHTNTKIMLAPPKLKVQRQLNSENARSKFPFSLNSGVNNTATNSSTVISPKTSNRPSSWSGNDPVTNSLFSFGDINMSDNYGSKSSVPSTTLQSIPIDAKRDLYRELGRLIFGENSSELSKDLAPNKPVTAGNIFPGGGVSNLLDVERATFSTVEAKSAESKIGQASVGTDVKTTFKKPSAWSGRFTSGASSSSSSNFWNTAPSFPATKLFGEPSSHSKDNLFTLGKCNTNSGGMSEATTSTGLYDVSADSSRCTKKPNLNRPVPSFSSTTIFSDPTIQNLSDFFNNIPKSSVLTGSSVTSTLDPPLENRTISGSVSNDSSNNIFDGVVIPAEKE